jgi:hypothetical protein
MSRAASLQVPPPSTAHSRLYSVKELHEALEKIQLPAYNVRGGLGHGTNRAPETRPDV